MVTVTIDDTCAFGVGISAEGSKIVMLSQGIIDGKFIRNDAMSLMQR
jgi:hypothetical protein